MLRQAMNDLRREHGFVRCLVPYGVAVSTTGLALSLSMWLQPFLVGTVGSFFYLAVIFSTWYGGLYPGIVAIVLSTLAINFFFIPPLFQLTIAEPSDWLRLSIFFLVAFVINLLNNDLRRSRSKVEQLSRQLLQESSDRLRMALTAAQMGMWDWDMVTGEIVWSPEHESLFGLELGTFDGKYETFDACLHPSDRAGLMGVLQASLQSRAIYQHEYRVLWPDGSVHWIEGRGRAFYDQAGHPIRMSGTVMNIDERQRSVAQQNRLIEQEKIARQSAQAAQKRVTTILESISDACVMLDSQWCYTYVNSKAGQLVGRSPEDLIGKNIWVEFPEGIGQVFYQAYYKAVAEQQPIQLEEYYIPWDRWFENRIYPSGEGLTIFFQDITDRKQTEIALMKSEKHLRTILDAEPECVKVVTAEGIVRSINPAGLAIMEADSAEQVQGSCIFPLICPAYREAFQRFIQQVANGQSGIFEFEGTGVKGSHHWLESHAVPLQYPDDPTTYILAVTRDITDRKQTEIALRESEERLRQILQDMPVMLDAFDEAWNIIVWNHECERVTGFSADDVINSPTIMEKFYPNAAYRAQMIAAWSAGGNNYRNWEWEMTCKDGSTRTIAWSNISELFPVSGWASWGIGVDVTDLKRAKAKLRKLNLELEQRVAERTAALFEANDRLEKELSQRKRTERALQESELKFHAMFDQSRLFIGLLRPDGMVFEVNLRPDELTSMMGEVFVGRWFWEFAIWGPNQERQMRDVFERAVAGEVVHLEMSMHDLDGSVLQRPDGSIVTHDIRVKAVKNAVGEVMFLTIEGWDITDLKRAEASLRESDRRWRSLLDNVQLVVIELDIQGNVNYANPFFLNLTGYSAEEVLGHYWFDRFLSVGQKKTVETSFRDVLAHNFHVHYQNPILTRAGEERMIAWNNTVLRDTMGHPMGTISIGEDITDRYHLEQMKTEFVAIVSHELRTPLTSMQAALSLLVEKIIDPASEDGEIIIQIASDGVDRLVRLVNDILSLERLESGKVRLEKRLCNTSELMTMAIDQMQDLAKQSNITIEAEANLFQIMADSDRLLQVLTNLLSNAIKFSPLGSKIWLGAEFISSALLTGRAGSSFLRFMVKDTGRGIPREKLDSIFERFQQVDASDARQKGGTGLGLAICRSIIEQHGGRIWAESVLGQGCIFYFTIPAEDGISDGSQTSVDY